MTQGPSNIGASDREAMVTVLSREHRKIAKTSTLGRWHLVSNSGHLIQVDQPQAVVDAVNEILAASKEGVR